jgi:drug/metabolite transporter (DMT)-like permease
MWQLLIILYFVFATTSYLLRRVLAQKLGDSNRLANVVFFLFFLLPTAIILSFFLPHNLNVGLVNLLFLFGGSIIWPLLGIITFSANKKVDVGIFAIINNLSPIFTLAIALPFLHESLKTQQFIGVGLLIFSGIIASFSQLHKHNRVGINGILICLLSAAVLGIAIAYESFMLSRIDFGTYLIYGWGSQIIWSLILAGRELKKLPQLLRKDLKTRQILFTWGSVSALRSVAFILALKMSGSASIISAATDFLSVTVVIAAYIFLKERQHMVYKLIAVVIGITGLFLITR